MLIEVQMPRMGQSMEEGKIVEWLVKVGDKVKRGDPIAELETDKAVITFEAMNNGTIEKINVANDETVPVGTVLALIEDGKPGTDDSTQLKEEKPVEPKPPELTPSISVKSTEMVSDVGKTSSDVRVKASPVAKRLAQELGVDLSLVKGSGPGGLISKEDVRDFKTSSSSIAEVKETRVPATAVPMTKMKKVTAERMAQSKSTIPHFYISMDINVRNSLELRQSLNKQGKEISVNDLIVKAVVIALKDFPNLNSTFSDNQIIQHPTVDMAIAVTVDDGLITPVLKDCGPLSLIEISERTKDLVNRARTGNFKPEDLEAGTFTISNLGMYDVKGFSAIVNPPQVAILAVGKVQKTPIFDPENNITSADLLTVTVSADHRATDGVEVAKFMKRIKEALEEGFTLLIN
jgi:pyruvate dehydrogenase E2 component (dihydrolipoamide acetyltransferase)